MWYSTWSQADLTKPAFCKATVQTSPHAPSSFSIYPLESPPESRYITQAAGGWKPTCERQNSPKSISKRQRMEKKVKDMNRQISWNKIQIASNVMKRFKFAGNRSNANENMSLYCLGEKNHFIWLTPTSPPGLSWNSSSTEKLFPSQLSSSVMIDLVVCLWV